MPKKTRRKYYYKEWKLTDKSKEQIEKATVPDPTSPLPAGIKTTEVSRTPEGHTVTITTERLPEGWNDPPTNIKTTEISKIPGEPTVTITSEPLPDGWMEDRYPDHLDDINFEVSTASDEDFDMEDFIENFEFDVTAEDYVEEDEGDSSAAHVGLGLEHDDEFDDDIEFEVTVEDPDPPWIQSEPEPPSPPLSPQEDASAQALKAELTNSTLHGKLASGDQINKIPSNSGVANTAISQPLISWIQNAGEIRMAHNNAAIRIGPDMPAGDLSGYGAKGAQGCDTIDLCTGFGQSNNDGQGLEHGTITKNNIITDAARIYISAMTDIDQNFGLAHGTVGNSVGNSGIGIKADAVRIVGRQGIKIVTGKMRGTDERSANGATLGGRAGIDLIAGNYTGSKTLRLPGGASTRLQALQPAIMGDNLVAAITDVEDHINQLRAAVFNMSATLSVCLSNLGAVLATNWRTAAATPALLACANTNVTHVMEPMYSLFLDQIFWQWRFLDSSTDRYICSRNVRIT